MLTVTSVLVSAAVTTDTRIALVTGGNKGIGMEIARKLAAVEDTVTILGCRNEDRGRSAAEELAAGGAAVLCRRLDLSDHASIAATREFIEREYGRLDVLVNNAAVCFNDPTLYGQVEHTPFERQASITINTNYFGTLGVCQEMLPLLRKSGSPRVVNIASAAGRLRGSQQKVEALTSPSLSIDALSTLMTSFVTDAESGTHLERGWPNTCYGVSKMGVIGLTKVLAREEPSLMVNAVDPGFCATDQNQNQGHVTAERGARTAALLATLPAEQAMTGKLFFEEREIDWSYQ